MYSKEKYNTFILLPVQQLFSFKLLLSTVSVGSLADRGIMAVWGRSFRPLPVIFFVALRTILCCSMDDLGKVMFGNAPLGLVFSSSCWLQTISHTVFCKQFSWYFPWGTKYRLFYITPKSHKAKLKRKRRRKGISPFTNWEFISHS